MNRLVKLVREVLEAPVELPFIVDGLLPEQSLAAIVAAPSAGKSVFTWDMIAHVALGRSFRGRGVQSVGVVYVCGEGAVGLPGRIRAWCTAHAIDPEDFDGRLAVVTVPLDVSDGEMVDRVLVELAELELDPGLIVFDTWSACAPHGFDESSTRDAKGLMDLMRGLRDRLQCTILLIHHAGYNGERERGSSDFGAALDVRFFLKNDEGLRTLSMTKGRDVAPIQPIRFRVVAAHGSVIAEYLSDDANAEPFFPSMRLALQVLREHGDAMPVTLWKRRCEGTISRSGFYDTRRRCEKAGFVVLDKRRGAVLTTRGEEALKLQLDTTGPESTGRPVDVQWTSKSVQSAPPYRGRTTGHLKNRPMDEKNSPLDSDLLPAGGRGQREEGPGLQEFPWDALEVSP